MLPAAGSSDEVLARLPDFLSQAEVAREASTMLILVAVSLLAASSLLERWAMFLWMFAFWDIFYYEGLWLMIGWPPSFFTPDVLFLIPTAWVAQVWFPLLVSLLALAAVAIAGVLPLHARDRRD